MFAANVAAASTIVGPDTWLGDMAGSWRPQLAVMGLVAAVLALATGRRVAAALLLAVTLVQGGDMAWLRARSAQATAGMAPAVGALTVVEANLLWSNDDPGRLIAWIGERHPDILVLTELSPRFATALNDALPDYLYHLVDNPESRRATAIYSRWPITTWRLIPLLGDRAPSWAPKAIVASVMTDRGTVRVAALHPTNPLRPHAWWRHNQELDLLARALTGLAGPTVVAGDFNATPWSPALRRFAQRLGLSGYNVAATWPDLLGPFGLALDHILVSPDLTVDAIGAGPEIGSDHRPLIATIAVQGSPGTP